MGHPVQKHINNTMCRIQYWQSMTQDVFQIVIDCSSCALAGAILKNERDLYAYPGTTQLKLTEMNNLEH